ncbi:ATP-binding protein [Streptomyces sp. NPDC005805]|uniref:ATP-binding protein n=1 Tax=Streptomyces sp. NPDC005805 TaxID=3157068 RepID=UPI0033D37010
MPVPASSPSRRNLTPRPVPAAVQAAWLVAAAVVGAAVSAAAPDAAGSWVLVTVCAAWLCLAAAVVAGAGAVGRARRASAAADAELRTLRARSARFDADAAHLVNVTVPSVVKRVGDGESAEQVLATVTPPKDAQLRRVLQTFGSELTAAEQRARSAAANSHRAVRQLALAADGIDRLTSVTVPATVARLREGASAETVLGELELPADSRLRVLADALVRELALSERRAAAAQGASAKALSRVQAKAVSMLADLRDMQDRHGEEVFGDLLRLDHNTSQLGLMTDRLALLMGGRASRAWNKPIPVESVLRGAAGRIAAYQRVRLHSSSTASLAGFAAEGVMHLLAELMDNAANFSPPVDEVHVYVEERTAGLVVTIEDSGLKMADAAMRRAEEAVSGRVTDLAHLQGTRLGLTVVGMLAAKYGMSVSFRPSSRGGTGVVVLFPSPLLAQPRDEDAGDDALPAGTPEAPTASGSGTSLAGGARVDYTTVATPPGGTPVPAAAAPWDAGAFGDATTGAGTLGAAGAYETGAYGTGARGAGAYDTGSFGGAGAFATGPNDSGAFATGPGDSGAFATGPGDSGAFVVGPTGVSEPGAYDTGSYDTGSSGSGKGDAAPHGHGTRRVATAGGLPVRPPGRTMAAADRGRPEAAGDRGEPPRGARDAGAQFGAFAQARRTARAVNPGDPGEPPAAPEADASGAGQVPEPRAPHDTANGT